MQELLGGRFGEMSTLMNYMHQSVAIRAKKKIGPFYELVASITAEELGHVELVAATINGLLDQTPTVPIPWTRRTWRGAAESSTALHPGRARPPRGQLAGPALVG